MPIELSLELTPKQASDQARYLPLIADRIAVPQSRIALVRIVRRSIDARSRQIRVNLGVQIYVDGEQAPPPVRFDYPQVGVARRSSSSDRGRPDCSPRCG